jgi:hypothetical protein
LEVATTKNFPFQTGNRPNSAKSGTILSQTKINTMSDTPRTDAITPDFRIGAYDRLTDHARQLERELAIATMQRDRLATSMGQDLIRHSKEIDEITKERDQLNRWKESAMAESAS